MEAEQSAPLMGTATLSQHKSRETPGPVGRVPHGQRHQQAEGDGDPRGMVIVSETSWAGTGSMGKARVRLGPQSLGVALDMLVSEPRFPALLHGTAW